MNKDIVSNILWRFAERSGAQIVSIIVSIVLARLLTPTIYGIVAMAMIFTNILQVFVDNGLGNALIQKKDADDLDFSTVFYTNMIFCFGMYGLMFLVAPIIAEFYDNPEMVPLIRALSLIVIISGLKNIQQAYVARNLLFKKFFFSTIGGTLISAIIGIFMAYKGFGVWALVSQQLSNAAIDTIILWITVNWRPHRMFSINRLKSLFSYGWKLLVSSFIDATYNNLTSLIIGKRYSADNLAYYNQGQKFPSLAITNVITSIDSVLLPVLSNEQDSRERVKSLTRTSLKASFFIMAPLMLGLCATSENVVRLLLGEKWIEAVFYMQIFCIVYLFWPIHTVNLNAIKALGRSDIFLKVEVVKKIIGLMLIFVSMNISVKALAFSMIVNSIFSTIVNAKPNKELMGYGYREQFSDILLTLVIACTMGVIVWGIGYVLDVHYIFELILQVTCGIAIYILLSILFQKKELIIIISRFRRKERE